MKKIILTNRQLDCLDSIKSYIKKYKMSPTYRDIAELMGTTPGSVYTHIVSLCAAKYIKINNKLKSRKITVIK